MSEPTIVTQLRTATAGLLYPSETDAPFEILEWPGKGSARAAVEVHTERRPVDEYHPMNFFDEFDDHDEAPRFKELERVMKSGLSDLAGFHVGEGTEIDVYIIGWADGRWVGLKTLQVNT